MSVLLISMIIQQLPYFHDLQQWFLTYHMDFPVKLLEEHIPWPDIVQSLCVLLGINVTLLIGRCGFQKKKGCDIKT